MTWWSREVDHRGHPASIPAEELNESTFEVFHTQTSPSLWAYLRRLTNEPQAAEDLHQEAYIRYLNHPCPSSEPQKQKAYLLRIASNLVLDRWRRQQRERGWFERLFPPSPQQPRKISLELDLDHILGQLKPQQRALLWLAYAEEYSHQEIAEVLNLSPASVKVLLFRARRRMAHLLARNGWHGHSPPAIQQVHDVGDRKERQQPERQQK